MCKFCNLMTLNGEIGERTNGCMQIAKIKDGTWEVDVCLNRYVVESEHIHESSLILGTYATIRGTQYSVKEKLVKIKYCPFCGEEL